MKKRLRKKKHLGEYRVWGVEIAVTRNRADGFDEFLDAFIDVIEAYGCYCCSFGRDDKLDSFVELGRLAADPEAKLHKIAEWLGSRSDVDSWKTGKLFDVWHDSTGQSDQERHKFFELADRFALEELVKRMKRRKILGFEGKVRWDGNLNESRLDRV